MNAELYLPGLSHFQNDNGWSGSRGMLSYEIEKPLEGRMRVVIWCGPFCRDYSQEEAEAFFELSNEGISALGAWLLERAEEMNTHPPRTPEECRAYYETLRRGENKIENN